MQSDTSITRHPASTMSAAAPASSSSPAIIPASITTVQLDGLVLLKIINHAKESAPDVVSGQLLGLDNHATLEITASYPLPAALSSAAEDAYQLDMMKMLRQVNVDNNTVGWYQSLGYNSPFDAQLVDAQYHYQRQVPNAVMLLYDPVQTARGRLTIHAYRLSDTFMSVYERGAMYQHIFNDNALKSTDIFQSLPIKIHNSHLVHGFLYELRESKRMLSDEILSVGGTSAYLSTHVNACSSGMDEYLQEQSQFQFYQRSVSRQRQAQINYLNKVLSEVEVKAMQTAASASSSSSSPTAAANSQQPSQQHYVDLQKDINTLIQFVNGNTNNLPVTLVHIAAFAPLLQPASVESIVKNAVFRSVGRANRLNNYLLTVGMDESVGKMKRNAVQSVMKYYLIDSVHKDGARA